MNELPHLDADAGWMNALDRDPQRALDLIGEIFIREGICSRWQYPLSTNAVLLAAAAVGFDLLEDRLRKLIRLGKIETISKAKVASGTTWTAREVADLFAFLRQNRAFLPGRWWSVKTAEEKSADDVEADRALLLLSALVQRSRDELLLLAAQPTTGSPMRELALRALKLQEAQASTAESN